MNILLTRNKIARKPSIAIFSCDLNDKFAFKTCMGHLLCIAVYKGILVTEIN